MITTLVKLTRSQLTTLQNGGTVGSHTYDPDHCLYMVDDGLELPTESGRYVLTTDDDGESFQYEILNLTWNEIDGKPSTFPPSAHTHSAADITTGTVAVARLPVGTAATQVAAGNHTHSAYVNQNAFGNVKVGSTTTAASSTTDTVTFAAGGDLGVSISGKTVSYSITLPTQLPASDVYNWAKAATKPAYDWSEIANKPFSGVSFVSGNSSNGEHNANNITTNGHYYYTTNGPVNIGEQYEDGALYAQSYNTNWVGQIAQDYHNGSLFVRGKNDGSWTKWKKVVDVGDKFVISSDMYYNPTSQTLLCSKTSNGWNSGAYGTIGYKTNCYVKGKSTAANVYIMIGLNSDPSSDHDYRSIDYALYTDTTNVSIFESGTHIGNFGTNTPGDEYKVEYVGGYIKYYHNNECIRSVARAVGTPLYFDSSFYSTTCSMAGVDYGELPQSFALDGQPQPPTAHNHDASNITSGTIALARLPVGTAATQVAAGNHTHLWQDITDHPTVPSITVSNGIIIFA